jgi:response regulator RpfG family c-di-GMP phosphodiesterase
MPIVLTSPLVDEDTNRQAQMCGATAVIKKPFSWERLVTQIGTLLAPKQSPESSPETAQVPLHKNRPAEIKARLAVEQEHRRFEDQATELRNSLIKATETISMLEARLAQSQEHCSQLTQKIKEIEYAAAWAERLTKFLADLSESKLRETEPGVTSRTEGS